MATMELPPRRRSTKYPEITIQRNRSSLDILMQMGFPRHRAEKALAATGDKGVQLASDWLLSHVSDPTLDDKTPRDYILYLCPVGQLQSQLIEFWQKTYSQCGWNRAHNYFPHITLCSFFKSDDSKVPKLSHAIKTVGERCKNTLEQLELEYFSSTNFIGLFVSSNHSPCLKKITTDFAEEAKNYDVVVEPHKKQLHVSLSYQFPTEMKDKLESAAKGIDILSNVRWDLRLYSRDTRMAKKQVWKVIFAHTPNDADELELIDGDFIYVTEAEASSSPDGWFQGTSWLTGCTGMFPGNYTERTAETETWTMHRSIPIIGAELDSPTAANVDQASGPPLSPGAAVAAAQREQLQMFETQSNQNGPPLIRPLTNELYTQLIKTPRGDQAPLGTFSGSHTLPAQGSPKAVRRRIPSTDSPKPVRRPVSTVPPQPQVAQPSTSAVEAVSRPPRPPPSSASATSLGSLSNAEVRHQRPTEPSHQSPKHVRRTPPPPSDNTRPTRHRGPRQLYVIRHGERIDFTFGKDWTKTTFDASGNYIRHDLNLPKSLPRRKGGPQDYNKDSPLTVQGHFQAHIIGEALKEKDVPISYVYSSPSLRCVETSVGIMKGLGIQREINLEPGLFEWLGWYQSGLPKFMSPADYREHGYNVGTSHQPIWPYSKFNTAETTEQYYERCYLVSKEILKKHDDEGGNILLIAHKGSIDVCTRQLLGKPPRPRREFRDLVNKVPFCAVGVIQEDVKKKRWSFVEPPACFSHKHNAMYDWKIWI